MTNTKDQRYHRRRECNQAAASDSMLVVGLFVDRLSHGLRSPLAVVQSVVNDLIAGYEVDTGDLKDAQSALTKVLKIVDLVVNLALARRSESGSFCLSDVLQSMGERFSDQFVAPEMGKDADQLQIMDLALSQHAIYCLDVFVKSCIVGSSGDCILGRSIKAARVADRLSWSLIIQGGKDLGRFVECKTLSDVAMIVNSPAVLGLLLAESAMILNGFSSSVSLISSEELRFDLNFFAVNEEMI